MSFVIFLLLIDRGLFVFFYCKRRAKKAESDAATMEPTTGKATVAEEAPGDGAGDSIVAAVTELTNTAEIKRATKMLLMFFISIISCVFFFCFFLFVVVYVFFFCVFLCDALKVKVVEVFIL